MRRRDKWAEGAGSSAASAGTGRFPTAGRQRKQFNTRETFCLFYLVAPGCRLEAADNKKILSKDLSQELSELLNLSL